MALSCDHHKGWHDEGVRALLVSIVLSLPATVSAQVGPSSLRSGIELRYPQVAWVTVDELRAFDDVVLLDARMLEEFAVSHLEGASRIDPDHPNLRALRVPRDARVVVYCSVGWRSAAIADRLRRAGYARVYNLDGGIFEWANRGLPVVRGGERVLAVHPFDATWGRLLRRELHAYRP